MSENDLVEDASVLAERIRYEANLLEVLDETSMEGRHGTVDVRGSPGLTALMVGPVDEGQGRVDRLLDRLRPLLTGAAWKILDQLVEHQLGHRPGDPHRPITGKLRSAEKHGVKSPLPKELRNTWHGLLDAYREYVEVRHGLIHRTAYATNEGGLVTTLDDGVTPTKMTTPEQTALCRLSRRVADYVLHGRSDYDICADMGQQLNLLTRVTQREWPARNRAARVEFIDYARPGLDYKLRPAEVEQRVLQSLPTTTSIDVVIEIDRGQHRFLVGPLELARDEELAISEEKYPAWMIEEVRPDQRRPRGLDDT